MQSQTERLKETEHKLMQVENDVRFAHSDCIVVVRLCRVHTVQTCGLLLPTVLGPQVGRPVCLVDMTESCVLEQLTQSRCCL